MIYFDWNATAPRSSRALETLADAHQRYWANPSTPYRAGIWARNALEAGRKHMAGLLGVSPERLFFTSGATEANNAVMRAYAARSPDGLVALSRIEHPSTIAAAEHYFGHGRIVWLPVSHNGQLQTSAAIELFQKHRPVLCSAMAINNETGVIQPWHELRAACQTLGISLHCDAVQWFGKLTPMDWSNCATVVLSGHKFGAPTGVGAIIAGDDWDRHPLQFGGAQESGIRSGTEAVPQILAMVAALEDATEGLLAAEKQAHLAEPHTLADPRDAFEQGLRDAFGDGVTVHGCCAGRAWNTCSVALPDFGATRWITRLDKAGFALSSGSACSTGKSGPSSVLRAMGVPDSVALRTVRISSGFSTTRDDWHSLLQAILAIHKDFTTEGTRTDGLSEVIDLENI